MTREQKLNLIWRHTHRDYRGKIGADRAILIYRHGTCLVPLTALSETEIAAKLAYALGRELKQKSA